eukprot:4089582-Pyramimonas_sp.AAC.1
MPVVRTNRARGWGICPSCGPIVERLLPTRAATPRRAEASEWKICSGPRLGAAASGWVQVGPAASRWVQVGPAASGWVQ